MRIFLIALAAACAVSAHAQSWPAKPVTMINPFAPGGGVDATARIISPKLSESMGQNWVVDNRTGAAGNLATEIVARSSPDGQTVLLALDPA